jgi:tetratricopeptide (TPR) repeat protein
VDRDLETICLKCLEKEPSRRYGSAEALAADLRRFLNHEPILARPASPWERGVKWAKRRPAAAALVLVSVLAVVSLLALGLRYQTRLRSERDRAEKNLALALQAVETLTAVAEKHLDFEPLLMEDEQNATLVQVLKDFLRESRTTSVVREESALVYQRTGDILRLLGENREAAAAYDQAILLWHRLAAAQPSSPELRKHLTHCQNYLGEVLRLTDQYEPAREAYAHAQRGLEQLVADEPGQAEYWEALARTHYNLGILWTDTNHPADAKRAFARAITCLQSVPEARRDKPEYQLHLARTFLNQASVVRRVDGFDAAKKGNETAISLLRKLCDKYSYVPRYQRALGMSYNNQGNLLSADKKLGEAEEYHRKALEVFRKLVDNFPKVPLYREQLANTLNSLGSTLSESQEKLAEARKVCASARSLFAELVKEYPNMLAYQGGLGVASGNLGWVLARQEKLEEARPRFQEAVGFLQEALNANQHNPDFREALRKNYQSLAETFVLLRDAARAAEAARGMAAVFPDRAQNSYYAACYMARCARLVQANPMRFSQYADQAKEFLRRAINQGLKREERLQKEQEEEIFRLLRERDGFAELLGKLEAEAGRPAR